MIYQPQTDAERRELFENMLARKRRFHRRLEAVADGFALAAGRDTPNAADSEEARRMTWPEYLACCRTQ
jgi:hypothetical protein